MKIVTVLERVPIMLPMEGPMGPLYGRDKLCNRRLD